MSSLAYAYSINIMPWSIAEFAGCPEANKDKIESVRKMFHDFVAEMESYGVKYNSQVLAWESFKEWEVIYNDPDDYEHLNDNLGEQGYPDWITRAWALLDDQGHQLMKYKRGAVDMDNLYYAKIHGGDE